MKKRKLLTIGFWITLISVLFGVVETVYFGSNWLPESKAKFICDCVSLFFCAVGLTLIGQVMISHFIQQAKDEINNLN